MHRRDNGADEPENFMCKSHSGLIARINGLYAIITILIALVGAQMVFQVPSMKYDILKEMTKVTDRIADTEKANLNLGNDIKIVAQKLTDHVTR